jgi:hypothetical protein
MRASCVECPSPATHQLRFGVLVFDACERHAEAEMWRLSQKVPPDEGREGYLRWCRDTGVTPRIAGEAPDGR